MYTFPLYILGTEKKWRREVEKMWISEVEKERVVLKNI